MKQIKSSKIKGILNAPASKSVMIRSVAASLLAAGESHIINPSYCNDAQTAVTIAQMLGAEIGPERNREAKKVIIRGNNKLKEKEIKGNILDCSESGLCMRMFAPIVALQSREIILKASGSLMLRPMKMLEELTKLGATCITKDGYPPVTLKGRLKSGKLHLNGSESSQFLTGLLMALPLCFGDSVILVSDLKSKPYVDLTIDVIKEFGITVQSNKEGTEFHIKGNQDYTPQIYTVEGDWSSAAFFLVAGALAGSIKIKGLRLNSYQADKAIVSILKKVGAEVKEDFNSVSVQKGTLHAFDFDATNCPDLIPPLAALAGGCDGKSVIYGANRLKFKESDRSIALVKEFSKLGISIDVYEDRIEIKGNKIKWSRVDSHNDHRIAMACAIVALNGDQGVEIEHPECVSKSYPAFFEDLKSIQVT